MLFRSVFLNKFCLYYTVSVVFFQYTFQQFDTIAQKNTHFIRGCSVDLTELVLCLHLCEAFAAIYRSVVLRLERHARFPAAGSAGRSEILSCRTAAILSLVAAALAALRLILKTAFCVKFLLSGGENKCLSAVFAYDRLVLIHDFSSLFGCV